MRAIIAILVAGIGVLLSVELGRDTGADPNSQIRIEPLDSPEFLVTYSHDRIEIAGTSVSAEHEQALQQLVDEQFHGLTARVEFRPGVLPGAGWDSASLRLLYLVGAMESADVRMRRDKIDVRGVTMEIDAFSSRMNFLRANLPTDASLETDIVVVRPTASFDELCQRAFASLFLEPVSFHESSARIRRASLVTLDRITEFARDCPTVKIGITGHSDASGDESWNRQLSRSRAQAVADHVIANGIDPSRLIVSGLGSAEPIADNSTRRGRELNRRIEFELR